MKRHKSGTMLFLGLASLLSLLFSCRSSTPPAITVCIGDGFGGADCVLPDNTRVYKSPSELKNAWITSQQDMQAFAGWCYDVSAATVMSQMAMMKRNAQGK